MNQSLIKFKHQRINHSENILPKKWKQFNYAMQDINLGIKLA